MPPDDYSVGGQRNKTKSANANGNNMLLKSMKLIILSPLIVKNIEKEVYFFIYLTR